MCEITPSLAQHGNVTRVYCMLRGASGSEYFTNKVLYYERQLLQAFLFS